MEGEVPRRHSTRRNFGQPPHRLGQLRQLLQGVQSKQVPVGTTSPPPSVTSRASSKASRVSSRRKELELELEAEAEARKLDRATIDVKKRELDIELEKQEIEAQRRLTRKKLELQKVQIQEEEEASNSQELSEDEEEPSVLLHDIHQHRKEPEQERQLYQPVNGYESPNFLEFDGDSQMRQLTAAMTTCFEKLAEAQRPVRSAPLQEVKHARSTIGKELTSFSGAPEEWPAFIAEYDECSDLCKFSDRENLQRLRKSLRGKAKEVVQSLLNSPDNVPDIIETLRLRFGKASFIMFEMIEKVKKLPTLTDDKPAKFLDFSTAVQNLVTTAKSLQAKEHLMNPQLLMDLISKLPSHMKYDWGSFAVDKENANLVDFGMWINGKAKAVSTFTIPKFENEKKIEDRRKSNKILATAEPEKSFNAPRHGGKTGVKNPCVCCSKSGHQLPKCFKFAKLEPEERWKLASEKRICFSCLEADHSIRACPKKTVCGKNGCSFPHHQLLHKDKIKKPDAAVTSDCSAAADDGEKILVNRQDGIGKKTTIYKILPVTLYGPKRKLETYAIFDTGSYVTLLDSTAANLLGLTGTKTPLEIKGASDMTSYDHESRVVSLGISGTNNKKYQLTNVRTKTNLDMPTQSVDLQKLPVSRDLLQKLKIPELENAKPMLLIGLDNVHLITSEKVIRNQKTNFVLGRTQLGWTIYGQADSHLEPNKQVLFLQDSDEDLNQLIKDHFKLENLGVKINERMAASIQDRRAVDIMEKTTRRIGNRWETGLLWKSDNVVMPDNKSEAMKRLIGIEKRIDRDPAFAKLYNEKMHYNFDQNFARKLTKEEATKTDDKTWYIPHFGVFNPNKPGKIRLVFDAAAKSKGVSLNDRLLTGPDLLVSLPGCLLKFRQRKIGLSGDIKDFFPQVKIRKEDQNAQRFLWRGEDRHRDPDVFVMQVCIFGAANSPFSCQSAKNKNAKELEHLYHEASKAIVTKTYMDDYLDSVETENEAAKIIQDVIQVNQAGGFSTTNWSCSSQSVLQQIPPELRSTGKEMAMEAEMKTERVLGLNWNPNTDTLGFNLQFHKVDPAVVSGDRRPTKRDILKIVMSVFDPLGLLAHFTIQAKILIQDIWKAGLGWDDSITDKMNEKWRRWMDQLEFASQLSIPRRYCFQTGQVRTRQLHLFCDASEAAYGAVAYLRTETDTGIDVSLVVAKSRVAPLKPTSIPRLELQSALVASRLGEFIKNQLELKLDRIHYWSDSATVLLWLRSESRRFKTFVSHRLGEIEELTEIPNWHWISTKSNVADDLTRDSKPATLDIKERWFNGPDFLYLNEEDWPKEKPSTVPDDDILELKPETVSVVSEDPDVLPDINRFSSWLKLVRTTAWMIRFVKNCSKRRPSPSGVRELTVQELDDAELLLLMKFQRESFGKEIHSLKNEKPLPKDSRLWNLCPVLQDGILRVSGRLNNGSQIPEDVKNPIILDNNHLFTKRLLQHHHNRVGHHGQERMANEVRQKYWILHLRNSIRSTWSSCKIFQIRRAKPVPPMMGQLPAVRLESFVKPFTNTGIDYFGPITVTIGRRHEKRYGVLFTCLSTRAVHLEIADSLTTDFCIMAIQRMIDRRGGVKNLHSDNGTNFVGAHNELRAELEQWNQDKFHEHLAPQGIQWHFIPPAAPHMGGAWERLVQSVKKALTSALKEKSPKEEVLRTLMTRAEFAVNSHPLTYVSLDSADAEALTPNHFLIGEKSSKPPIFYDDQKFGTDLRRQWKMAEELTNHFWRRWIKEYLPTLTRRVKWTKPATPLQIGDLVIVADETTRNNWPRGIITDVFPGQDGQVRVVEVKTSTGIFKRPAAKICKLDVDHQMDIGSNTGPISGGRMSP